MLYDTNFSRFESKPKISSLDCSDALFKLLNVSVEYDEHLRIFDTYKNLVLLHYIKMIPEIYHIKGIIIDKEKLEVITPTFPHMPEYEISEIEDLWGNKQIIDFDNSKAFVSGEGTNIRIYHYDGEWLFSTHKKINGRNSKWSGPKFGNLFDSIWGDHDFNLVLNKNICYVFILSHVDHRLICSIPKSVLYHVGSFIKEDSNTIIGSITSNSNTIIGSSTSNNWILTYDIKLNFNESIIYQEPIEPPNKIWILEKVQSLNWEETSGVVMVTENPLRIIKILSPGYTDHRIIRGNEPNYRLRYLQLKFEGITDNYSEDQEKLRELYPEKNELFDKVEEDLKRLPEYLEKHYRERYVRRNFTILPPEIHFVLEYTRMKHNKNVSIIENIKNTLKMSNALQLNAMIRHMNSK